MQHRSIISAVAGVAVAVALTACGSDNTTSATTKNTAQLRIVNATALSSTVNAASGGSSLMSNLAFADTAAAARCVTVPAGNQSVNFTNSAGATLASTSSNFAAGQNYTVLLYGGANGSATNAAVLSNQFTAPSAGNMGVRFVNLTGASGDIYAITPTGTVSGSPAVSALTSFNGTASPSFTTISNANTQFVLYPAGTTVTSTTTPTATFNLTTAPSNGVTTVIFAPTASGAVRGFAVNTCQ